MNCRFAKTAALVAAASLASLAIGVAIGRRTRDEEAPPALRIHAESALPLVNPLLDCEDARSIIMPDLTNFRSHIRSRIDQGKTAGEIVDASYYFRQLNDGIWIGIREHQKILPGSLLKLPLAMAVFHKAQRDPELLRRELVFAGRPAGAPVQMFNAPEALRKGKAYTVEDLIRRLLRFSDNDAIGPLQEIVPDAEFSAALQELNVHESPVDGYRADLKTLSSFLRILYNATYLSDDRSQELLEMLTDPWFNKGIAGGMPKEIVAATKYGDTVKKVNGTEYFQFHEFGIVYHPEQPYLIGVYAVGADMDKLVGFVRDVSAITFEQVDTQARGNPAVVSEIGTLPVTGLPRP